MFVLSRVVVGLARQKKEQKRGNTFFCTYNSILDFYVLIVNRASRVMPGRRSGGESGKLCGEAGGPFASKPAPTFDRFFLGELG
ncbi:hypothetical protein BK660_12250 [Pseudomonas brassicacearum]|uniref:Uncharacterized protein n=1 Tax=Pseudomonas brassicacearum TaxID=930166 RepID=A0A423I320_9PSED|nr:hypothetical protein BK660_12250 [Pseudomonas brassicacearum]